MEVDDGECKSAINQWSLVKPYGGCRELFGRSRLAWKVSHPSNARCTRASWWETASTSLEGAHVHVALH